MAFGDFYDICNNAALPLCAVIANSARYNNMTQGILPMCYARNVDLANTIIFQIGNAFIHFGAIIVLLIIIFNVRAKYTAIARNEMLFFFYSYIALTLTSLIVDCGVAAPGSTTFLYFAAAQIGFAGSCCWSLMFSGFLGFQLWEDGTKRSMWLMWISSFGIFALNFIMAVVTFNHFAGTTVNRSHTMGLFIVMYVLNAVFIFIYLICQICLAVFSLGNLWALGAIGLAAFFLIAGQVLVYVFNKTICEKVDHYIDALFFGTTCNLFAVMMIYKFWDVITSEDTEFSVSPVKNPQTPEPPPSSLMFRTKSLTTATNNAELSMGTPPR
ncbi:hypothetical protein BABINDRAFT_179596 [Babjeviella inositovora NRRL Y-12698]|uniref:Chitin synthase export chaperone n=1 Tax=Babjeviella inositovora NRRL Y-12698 TaxID=984486 RepID=A0A1E3QWT2_9ASCO|nr:uncharacterized protein BABINDRAFT_179596 [Babjeviella inositovora NRRL Y-12698]ODQ82143.1 hypothetical protein BABINDRAFT_179596 [Babjeviella inositovora NRRL Y-12698]